MEKKDISMKLSEFLNSIESDLEPLVHWSAELKALWWLKKGDWGKAHDLAQEAQTDQGDWIHAHLHRMEGDHGNASYWYSRANKPHFRGDLTTEWNEIVIALLNQ